MQITGMPPEPLAGTVQALGRFMYAAGVCAEARNKLKKARLALLPDSARRRKPVSATVKGVRSQSMIVMGAGLFGIATCRNEPCPSIWLAFELLKKAALRHPLPSQTLEAMDTSEPIMDVVALAVP